MGKRHEIWRDQIVVKIMNVLAEENVMMGEVEEILDHTKLAVLEYMSCGYIPKWVPWESRVVNDPVDSEKQNESPAPAEPLSVA